MRIPKQRIRFATLWEGNQEPEGVLIIDLKGLDIEGVNTLVLDMAEVEKARSQGDSQQEAKDRARKLLGG